MGIYPTCQCLAGFLKKSHFSQFRVYSGGYHDIYQYNSSSTQAGIRAHLLPPSQSRYFKLEFRRVLVVTVTMVRTVTPRTGIENVSLAASVKLQPLTGQASSSGKDRDLDSDSEARVTEPQAEVAPRASVVTHWQWPDTVMIRPPGPWPFRVTIMLLPRFKMTTCSWIS
jgi:hypothetical protein